MSSDSRAVDPPPTLAWWPRLAFALAVGLLGGLANFWPLTLGPDVHLWMGNFAYILVAARLRAPYAMLAALLSVAPIYFHWGSVAAIAGFSVEALVVTALRSRGLQVLYADVLFWLLIGMPATALMLWSGEWVAPQQVFYICLKQAFNGVVYSSLAGVLLILAPRGGNYRWCQQPLVARSHRGSLVYAVCLVTAFSIASSALLISRWMIRYQESMIANSLQETSWNLARRTEGYLAEHVRNIEGMANWLSLAPDPALTVQDLLTSNHHVQQGFLTMLASDARGQIIAAAPASVMESVDAGYTVADRNYFREAMRGRQTYVSPVFRGRGFGSDPIVAISKAYYRGVGSEAPLGIVEGSLNLNLFSDIVKTEFDSSPVEVVLVDAAERVIYSSPGLRLQSLQKFVHSVSINADHESPDRIVLHPASGPVSYLADSLVLDNGWKIYALIDYGTVTRRIDQQYLVIFLLLSAAMFVASVLAERSGRRLTAPLETMARELAAARRENAFRIGPLPADASREVAVVHAELQRGIAAVADYRGEMESRIEARTRELQEANLKLQTLASADPLTGLHNRRSMEERFGLIRGMAERSGMHIAVVLVDLDHFKKLNDSHGHLTGDQCLVQIARLMEQEFRRNTDVVARFGGEEFVLVTGAAEREKLESKLENLRRRISEQEILAPDGQSVRVTASFGALVHGAGFSASLDDWLRVADICLYRAKDSGRDAIVVEGSVAAV